MIPSRVPPAPRLPPARTPHYLGAAIKIAGVPSLPSREAMAATIRAEGGDYIKQSADLGHLSPEVLDAASGLATAFLDGGDAAMWDAVTTGLSVGAGAVCAATPAAPVAPLCAVMGGVVGSALKSIFGSAPPKGPYPIDTHNARFESVYQALVQQCPDDRKGSGAIYNKCAAQLAVTCHLFTDGVSWGPVDPYIGDGLDFGGGWGWTMMGYGDNEGWPMLVGVAEEWRWVCGSFPGAFGNLGEPLPEFQGGCCSTPGLLAPCTASDVRPEVLAARREFWRFDVVNHWQGIPYYAGATSKSPGVPPPVFNVAVQRILTSARAQTERKFQQKVEAFAQKIQDVYLPRCNGSPQCLAGIVKDSFFISFDALATARGHAMGGGTAQDIVDRGVAGLDVWLIAGESGFDKDVKKQRDFKVRQNEKKAQEAAGTAPKKKPAGLSAGQVLGALLVAGAVGAGALAATRTARGLAPLPATWKPKGWLK